MSSETYLLLACVSFTARLIFSVPVIPQIEFYAQKTEHLAKQKTLKELQERKLVELEGQCDQLRAENNVSYTCTYTCTCICMYVFANVNAHVCTHCMRMPHCTCTCILYIYALLSNCRNCASS